MSSVGFGVRTEYLVSGASYRYCCLCDRMTIMHGDLCTLCERPRKLTGEPIYIRGCKIDGLTGDAIFSYELCLDDVAFRRSDENDG